MDSLKTMKSKVQRSLSRGASPSRSEKSESDGDPRDRGPERIINSKDAPHLTQTLYTDYVYVKTTSSSSSTKFKAKHGGYLGVKNNETDLIFIPTNTITEIDTSEYQWVKKPFHYWRKLIRSRCHLY